MNLPPSLSPKLSWLLFGIACLIFVVAKWADLSLPMYWDEIGVYGPGILAMVDNGISLLPSGLDPELSRGHPLWFYALFAGWVKLTGYSLTKIHLFALGISLGLFASVFHIAKKYSNPLLALGVSVIFMLQGIMIAQASLALPEVLLALELLWALYFFYERKYGWYFLLGSLALLTKESALVLPLACASWMFLNFLLKKEALNLKAIGIAFAPVSIYLLFLLIQKQTYGWYFFPYHMELVNLDTGEILTKFWDYFRWLFIDQGRSIIGAGLIATAGFLIYKKQLKASFLGLISIFALGFLCFSALNVYMDRYILSLFPIFMITLAILWDQAKLAPILIWSNLAIACFFAFSFQSQAGFRFDVDINYRDYLAVQKEASEFLEQEVPANTAFLGNFPLFNGFQDPRFGFAADTNHNKIWVVPHDSMEYRALLTPPSFANALPKEGQLIRTFEKGFTKVEVYRKKPTVPVE
ncbi:MAG: hypothetical protein AAGD28_03060 [Bacteroidota bacterium]